MQTETLSLTASPMANGYVKAKTGDDTTDETYQNWYKEVYLPSADPAPEPAPASYSMKKSGADTVAASEK